MMKASLLTTTAALAVASAASADFIGFDGTVEEVGEFTVIKMYAVYDAEDIGLNVYNAQIVTKDAGGFNQSDVQIGAGGTWAPNASLDIPGFADSAIDSFGTMGYGVGPLAATNGTALDPTFLDASGGLGAFVPSGGGWYNGNPTNEQVATTSLVVMTASQATESGSDSSPSQLHELKLLAQLTSLSSTQKWVPRMQLAKSSSVATHSSGRFPLQVHLHSSDSAASLPVVVVAEPTR